jgi:hypothetical protein
MTWHRATAILAGIVVSLICGQFFGYVSLVIGLVAYLVTRYALWAVAERRRFKVEFDQSAKDFRSNYQSFRIPSGHRYIRSIAFRDQLDWIGAAWVLA